MIIGRTELETIEEMLVELFEASIKGRQIFHFLNERKGTARIVIDTGDDIEKWPRLFTHKTDRYCLIIPAKITASQASDIIKKYWHRRISDDAY